MSAHGRGVPSRLNKGYAHVSELVEPGVYLPGINSLVVLGILAPLPGSRLHSWRGSAKHQVGGSTCRLKAMGIALNGMTYNSGGSASPVGRHVPG